MTQQPAEDAEEIEEIFGYIYTHWDCGCGYDNREEGDCSNEKLTCADCGVQVKIREVR